MNPFKFGSIVGLLLFTATAHAGVVSVVTGPNSFGQGFIFLDQDGVCKVATAGHVVKLADGQVFSRITIVDERGHTPELGAPIVLSSDPDIAVLPVIGANDPAVCGDGRLSAIGIARRIKETTSARIETTDGSGVVRVPVRWRAAAQDAEGGSIFTVTPANAEDRIVKGWSGSVVLDKDGLLGIIYEVDATRNEAFAVRADRIRELLDAARLQTRTATPNTLAAAPVVSLAGTTPDPSHGPNDIYHSGDAAWNVLPAQGKISFLVTFPSSIHLKGVALTYASEQNAPVGVEVAVSAAPNSDDWTSLNYCPIKANDGSIHCAVVTSTASKVRVTLKTGNDNAMNLSGFSIIQASSPQASAHDHSLGGLQPATSGGDEENIVFPNAESTNRTRDAAASPKVSSDTDKGTTNHGVTIPDSAIATSFYLKATKLLEQKGKINTKTRVISVPHECLEAFRRYLELAPNGTHASEVRSILDLFNRHGQ